ncbi:MAG TPA: LuxR C-terminal-related transcriptional regulator, partial [bacterium]|nr:LuxR C-terminal-related transcriptional regulator [bacterium]
MYLTFRRAKVSDFEAGFPFVCNRYRYDDSLRKDLFRFWAALLENGHEPMTVVEDRDQPVGERLVAFGTSFFAYDDFLAELKTTLPPFIDLRILEKWRSGKRPFLLKEEIVEAQLNGGLNAVAFNWGWDTQRYHQEDIYKIMKLQSQSYLSVIVNYRLKEFAEEVYGDEKDLLLNLGVDLLRDYREFLGTEFLPETPGEKHPYLMHFALTELKKNQKKQGTVAYNLVSLGPSRFDFRVNEQDVLKRALLGETDEEIADSLNLSPVTVKKRWQTIYEKVAAIDLALLEGAASDTETADNAKQKQRRRFLL